ncbi:MAG: universal stress protein [Bacteroidetes bacterium]|nr:universal stress protein [Bacteroidota bacterium]
MEDRLITIATTHYTAAEVLKARFESEKISCFLKHVNLLQSAVSEGVQIQIKSSDLDKALRLMKEWKVKGISSSKRESHRIRKILIPIDFSEFSKNACVYALNLARVYKTEIKILHVYYAPIVDLVPITDAYSIQIDMDINLRELESNAKKELIDFVNEIREIASGKGMEDVKISYALKEGIVEDEIIQTALEYKPGIIVLGSKGKGEKQSDIIGSVAYRVIDKSKVPVLAIPQNVVYDIKREKEMKSIIYATEFEDSDYSAIRRLMAIVSAFQVKIYCVHVSKDSLNTLDSIKMDNLMAYFKKINPKKKVEFHLISDEDKLKALQEFAITNKVDLIAMANRKRGILARLFNPDLAKKIIYQGNIPLLSFKA